MVEGSEVSQAQLKRELNQLSKEMLEIDLKNQSFRAQSYNTHIPALEAVKFETQKTIVAKGNRAAAQKGIGKEAEIGGYHGGRQGLSLPRALCWESHSMNHLPWPHLIVQ